MITTCIYHRADPDGKASAAVVRHFVVGPVHLVGWDYGDATPEIPKGDGPIYMVDICVEELLKDSDVRRRLIVIDHHKSAMPMFEGLPGLCYDGVAACRLAWAYFNTDKRGAPLLEDMALRDWKLQQAGEPELLHLIGLRDVWKHTGTPDEERCNLLNLALVANPDFTYDTHLRLSPDAQEGRVAFLVESGQAIESYARAIEREHAERGVMIRKWKGLRWLVLNTQARGSRALDNEALRQLMSGVQFDALMVWAYGTDGTVNASLYHAPTEASKKLDLSVHAKAMGGGGHAGACGFRAPTDWGYHLVAGALEYR